MLVRLAVAIGLLVPASAAVAQDDAATSVRRQVEACFSRPAGPAQDAVVVLRLDADGRIDGEPEIVRRGDGPADAAFAAAALRAVIRCAPYRAGDVKELRIVFRGESPATPEGAGKSAEGRGLPAGFCDVDRTQGGYAETLWSRLTPPAERGVRTESLAIDCATLSAAAAGRPDRPKRIFTVYRSLSAPPDPPTSLAPFLERFHERFKSKADNVWKDDLAVYVEQKPGGAGKLTGVSAYTLVDGEILILNIFDFTGSTLATSLATELTRVVRSRH